MDTVRSIEGTATAIEGNARGINDKFAALLPVTEMIANGPPPFGVDTINRNVEVVIGLSRDIEADLDNILTSVRAVEGHTASICDALIIIGASCTQP